MSVSAPKRFKRERRAGWTKPPGSRCVTRPGTFGNPFPLAEAKECGYAHNPALGAKLMFATWLDGSAYQDRFQGRRTRLLHELPCLAGFDLGCYCDLDKPCHADVLIFWANEPGCKVRPDVYIP